MGERSIYDFVEKPRGKDLDVYDKIIILKWIFNKWDGGAWTGLIWLRIGRGAGPLRMR
jgi:hypothetical protein